MGGGLVVAVGVFVCYSLLFFFSKFTTFLALKTSRGGVPFLSDKGFIALITAFFKILPLVVAPSAALHLVYSALVDICRSVCVVNDRSLSVVVTRMRLYFAIDFHLFF